MYCPKCGFDVNDANFCPKCGAAIVEILNQENNDLNAKVSIKPEDSKSSLKGKALLLGATIKSWFSPQARKKTLLILLTLVVIVVGIIFFTARRSPKAIAERYVKASLLDDYSTVCKLSAYNYKAYLLYGTDDKNEDAFFAECTDTYSEDIFSWDDLFAVVKKQRKEALEDSFGKFTFSIEVTREKDTSEKRFTQELERALEYLEKAADFDIDTLEDYKILTVKAKLTGEDETQRMTFLVYMGKVNGNWKVVNIKTE